jgi:hypothetical protein
MRKTWKIEFGRIGSCEDHPGPRGKLGPQSLIRNKNQLFSLRDTAMQLRSQRSLHVQGDAGHPG